MRIKGSELFCVTLWFLGGSLCYKILITQRFASQKLFSENAQCITEIVFQRLIHINNAI